jgi:hypothetical protein
MTEIFIKPVRYEVSVFPPDMHDAPASAMDAGTWVVTVEDRGHGKWAVIYGSGGRRPMVLSNQRGGEWDYEPIPSSRTDEWLDAHRFDLDTALKHAEQQAPFIKWNGMTAMDVLARHTAVTE